MPRVELDPAFVKRAAKLLKRYPDKRDRVRRALERLGQDPLMPVLRSKKYDRANNVWQSHIETNVPGAWRVWWVRSTAEPDLIIVLGFGPHP